jgi:hypothetical protein
MIEKYMSVYLCIYIASSSWNITFVILINDFLLDTVSMLDSWALETNLLA